MKPVQAHQLACHQRSKAKPTTAVVDHQLFEDRFGPHRVFPCGGQAVGQPRIHRAQRQRPLPRREAAQPLPRLRCQFVVLLARKCTPPPGALDQWVLIGCRMPAVHQGQCCHRASFGHSEYAEHRAALSSVYGHARPWQRAIAANAWTSARYRRHGAELECLSRPFASDLTSIRHFFRRATSSSETKPARAASIHPWVLY
jgi:hypothetical protein